MDPSARGIVSDVVVEHEPQGNTVAARSLDVSRRGTKGIVVLHFLCERAEEMRPVARDDLQVSSVTPKPWVRATVLFDGENEGIVRAKYTEQDWGSPFDEPVLPKSASEVKVMNAPIVEQIVTRGPE
jgi:hypothetical protein